MNRQILREASEWFVEFRVGDAGATVRERFDAWLRQSPEHIRAYIEIATTYVDLPRPGKLDVEALIAAARAGGKVVPLRRGESPTPYLGTDDAVRPGASERRAWLSRRALAASIAILAVGAGTLTWLSLHRDHTYATEIGERRSITLGDGSTIDLNARSRIRVHFSRSERDIELIEGQALVEVAHDPSRPFVVRSGETSVTAVGTKFEVDRRQSGTTVTVVEGHVTVATEAGAGGGPAMAAGAPREGSAWSGRRTAPLHRSAYLAAGEQVTVRDGLVDAPRSVNVAAKTAWTRRQLIFDGTRLVDALEDINRYTTRPLVIADHSLDDLEISGVLSTDPESMVRFLQQQPGLRVTLTDEAVRITRQ